MVIMSYLINFWNNQLCKQRKRWPPFLAFVIQKLIFLSIAGTEKVKN